MISKIFSIFFVYALCLSNLILLTLPFTIFLVPIFLLDNTFGTSLVLEFFGIVCFFISIFMVMGILLDYIFGFSVTRLTIARLDTKSYKSKEFSVFLPYLDRALKEAVKRFPVGSVGLYIKKSSEINAFAVGSMRRNAIIISTNLLNLLQSKSENEDELYAAISGVIGHEMSHLVNKDFLPGLILSQNRSATHRISIIISHIYTFLFFLLSKIPFLGKLVVFLTKLVYKLTYFICNLFLDRFIVPFYSFVDIFISKYTEFRCDSEAAKVFGSQSIGTTLQFLGEKTYNSLFSHHPSIKNRLKNIQNIKQIKSRVLIVNPISNLLNLGTVLSLFLAPYLLYKFTHIQDIIDAFIFIYRFIAYYLDILFGFCLKIKYFIINILS